MNKRIIVLLSMLATLAASNAFASRAHVLAMGTGDAGSILGTTGNMGSFYVDDAYNIFYNPSYINDFKNWGTIEKSNGVTVLQGNPPAPSTGAEGGFVASVANFNIGAYMNRPSQLGNFLANAPNRPIDVFVGSDMGVKWGLGFSYASNSFANADNSSNTDWAVHAGVQIADLEPFLMYEGASDDTGFVSSANSSKIWMAGVKYHWGEWVPYAAWLDNKYAVNGGDSATVTENWGFGLGRNTKIAEGARMAYAVSYWRQTKLARNILPIDFSVEGDAMSWLTVRAGLSYHLWDKTAGVSNGDMTTGRIGATVHMGKADFDFTAGKAVATTGFTEAPIAGTAGSNVDAQYFDIGPGLFTAASISYHW